MATRAIFVTLEGNIGSGKSTLLQRVQQLADERQARQGDDSPGVRRPPVVRTIQEPVHEWSEPLTCGDEGTPAAKDRPRGMLQAFYADCARNAFPFQLFVLCSRVKQAWRLLREARHVPETAHASGETPDTVVVYLTERCMQTDMELFARAAREEGRMDDVQWSTYLTWYTSMTQMVLSDTQPAHFIYLRTPPEVCLRRVGLRSREGEQAITEAYLRGLHERHDAWLLGGDRRDVVRVLDDSGAAIDVDGHAQAVLSHIDALADLPRTTLAGA